jgi:phospholipase C
MALLLALTSALGPTAVPAFAVSKPVATVAKAAPVAATPIQHLVVIFQENVSFDHYFGTYPHARNPPGEPAFTAPRPTPRP